MIGQPRHAGDRAKLNSNTNRDGTKLDLFPFCFRPHDNRDRSIAIPVVSILIGTEGFQKSGGHNSPEEPFARTIDVATSAPFPSNDDPSAVKGSPWRSAIVAITPIYPNHIVEHASAQTLPQTSKNARVSVFCLVSSTTLPARSRIQVHSQRAV